MKSNSVFHEFEVDKAIISDLIHAQNGTISTALRELVMNAIDAGSTCCDIKLNSTYFSIKDNGEGFKSKENIENLSDDYRKANRIINKEWDKVYTQYSQENDIPIELIKRLSSCHYPNDLFMALCHDKSGLVSFEYNSLINVKSLGSADVLYDFNPYSWELRGKTTQEIISSPQLRTEYALQAIKHIVDGIKKPIDRKAFIDNFFTENMQNQLNDK